MNKVILGIAAGTALVLLFGKSTGASGFVCPYDGMVFATQEELNQHMETAHPRQIIDIQWD